MMLHETSATGGSTTGPAGPGSALPVASNSVAAESLACSDDTTDAASLGAHPGITPCPSSAILSGMCGAPLARTRISQLRMCFTAGDAHIVSVAAESLACSDDTTDAASLCAHPGITPGPSSAILSGNAVLHSLAGVSHSCACASPRR